jgi:protein phosphatase 4 regulatory subunit 3
MNLQDDFYTRQITQNHLFEPILDIVYDTMPRDNLLNSACLELFEFIKRENIKPFILHIVENYRERLEQITYVDTFSTLILRYDQYRQGYNSDVHNPLFSQDDDRSPTRPKLTDNPRWQGSKEMDPTEEAYFNTSDDEDEIPPRRRPSNGTSPLLKSLVDYPDDDEDIMDTKAAPPETVSPSPYLLRSDPSSPSTTSSSPPSASPSSTPPLPTPRTPPERLAEKRRREEDEEEDELGKLTISKRRSSSVSSIASSVTTNLSNTFLRRKKGLASSNSKNSPSAGKKIEISLAMKNLNERGSKRDEGG